MSMRDELDIWLYMIRWTYDCVWFAGHMIVCDELIYDYERWAEHIIGCAELDIWLWANHTQSYVQLSTPNYMFSSSLIIIYKLITHNHMSSSPHTLICPAHHTHSYVQLITYTHMSSSWHTIICPAHHTHTLICPAHHTHSYVQLIIHNHMSCDKLDIWLYVMNWTYECVWRDA